MSNAWWLEAEAAREARTFDYAIRADEPGDEPDDDMAEEEGDEVEA